jgi:inner membrane protein
VDSLTQAVLGGTIGYAVGGRQLGRKAALWGMGLGTLPDLDVLVSFSDPIEDFIYHRSWSHSLFLLTAISPLIGEGIRRLHKLPASSRVTIMLMTWFVLITHPLLDSLTSYGTQLLWPLTSYPFAVSSVSIIDPIYTLPLLIATIWALIKGRSKIEGTLGSEGKASMVALVLSTLYLGWGILAQNQMQARVEQQIASASPSDASDPQILVTPSMGNSVLWYVLAVDDDKARYGWVSLLDADDQKIEWTDMDRNLDLLAKESEQPQLVQSLMNFTHGFYALEQHGDGQILLKDLRMGIAPDFVFRFLIAKQEAEQLKWNQPTVQLQRQINPDAASFLWNRMQGR